MSDTVERVYTEDDIRSFCTMYAQANHSSALAKHCDKVVAYLAKCTVCPSEDGPVKEPPPERVAANEHYMWRKTEEMEKKGEL